MERLGASESKDKLGLDLFASRRSRLRHGIQLWVHTVAVRGSVIVPVKANKMSLSATLKFKASKGRQKPERFVEGAPDVLEASFAGAAYEAIGLTLASTQAGEEGVEANSTL